MLRLCQEEDSYTCVNHAQSTDCYQCLVRPEQDVNSGPTDGVFEESIGPRPGAVEAGSNGVNGRKAALSDDHARHTDHHHGKGQGKRHGGR